MTNKNVLLALLVGVLITVPTTLYIIELQKNKKEPTQAIQQNQEPKQTASNEETTTTPTTEQTTTTPTAQKQQTTNQPKTNIISQNGSTTPTTSTPPATSTQKAPYNYTFSSGNRTANWYSGGTFLPNNGYTDEWISVTGKADATDFLNWRLSYNCSSGSACPAMTLQGSNDGASWINYKTLSSSSGTFTYPVLYTYYRLLLSSGACSSNACLPPTPPFPITYELSASGYFYY